MAEATQSKGGVNLPPIGSPPIGQPKGQGGRGKGMKARVIKVVKESDHKDRYALNLCEIEAGGAVWRADWTDAQLKIEQMRDRLVAAGADKDLVDEFQAAVSDESYRNGQDSMSEYLP